MSFDNIGQQIAAKKMWDAITMVGIELGLIMPERVYHFEKEGVWAVKKLKDELDRHKEYLKNAIAPIYECLHCGAREETFLSIKTCYKCKKMPITIVERK